MRRSMCLNESKMAIRIPAYKLASFHVFYKSLLALRLDEHTHVCGYVCKSHAKTSTVGKSCVLKLIPKELMRGCKASINKHKCKQPSTRQHVKCTLNMHNNSTRTMHAYVRGYPPLVLSHVGYRRRWQRRRLQVLCSDVCYRRRRRRWTLQNE